MYDATRETIEIYIKSTAPFIVCLRDQAKRTLEVHCDANIIQLEELTKKFVKKLHQFLQIAAENEISDYQVAGRALKQLHEAGQHYLGEVFGTERHRLKKYFLQKHPLWRRSLDGDEINPACHPPIVKFSGEGSIQIPLEFLPIFDFEWNEQINNHVTLYQAATKFLGYSTIICREFFHGQDKNQLSRCNGIIDNSSKLRVRYFKHDDLAHTRREEDFIKANVYASIINPWPTPIQNEYDFLEEFSNQLLNGASSVETELDHIQHFACHTSTEKKDTDKHSIFVSYPRKTSANAETMILEGEISIKQLKDKIYGNGSRDEEHKQYPFIFLNSCGSSQIKPTGASSFPMLFYQNKNRGFLGPELPIPDKIASEFSNYFYGYLHHGKSASEALHKAKRDLLKYYKSPLGLLYTMYANPNLKLLRPTPFH